MNDASIAFSIHCFLLRSELGIAQTKPRSVSDVTQPAGWILQREVERIARIQVGHRLPVSEPSRLPYRADSMPASSREYVYGPGAIFCIVTSLRRKRL